MRESRAGTNRCTCNPPPPSKISSLPTPLLFPLIYRQLFHRSHSAKPVRFTTVNNTAKCNQLGFIWLICFVRDSTEIFVNFPALSIIMGRECNQNMWNVIRNATETLHWGEWYFTFFQCHMTITIKNFKRLIYPKVSHKVILNSFECMY